MNKLADYHVHTSFSGDSDTSPEAMIEQAIRMGIGQLCITDHMDYDFTADGVKFEFDPKLYFEKLEKLKADYQDQLELNIGVEIGLQRYLAERCHNLAFSYPFDFVIGSIHVVNGKDPCCASYFEGREEEEGYQEYFECCLQNLEAYSNFDTFGHLDYIVRYGPNKNREYSYEKYREVIDAILQLLIRRDIGLEINTSGFRYGLGTTSPGKEILERYRTLGGKIITLGSDAHDPKHLACGFSEAKAMIKECGFESYFLFHKRIPEEISLTEP